MHETFAFDRFRLDPHRACLYRDSEVVPLTPTEYKLLLVLVQHRGTPVPREDLQKSSGERLR
jgi:DNA-binding winged helix-turn-helix (wHTH) protein